MGLTTIKIFSQQSVKIVDKIQKNNADIKYQELLCERTTNFAEKKRHLRAIDSLQEKNNELKIRLNRLLKQLGQKCIDQK